jgi:hypothetical protein
MGYCWPGEIQVISIFPLNSKIFDSKFVLTFLTISVL